MYKVTLTFDDLDDVAHYRGFKDADEATQKLNDSNSPEFVASDTDLLKWLMEDSDVRNCEVTWTT